MGDRGTGVLVGDLISSDFRIGESERETEKVGDRGTEVLERDLISSDFRIGESERETEKSGRPRHGSPRGRPNKFGPRQCGVREYLGDGTTSMWSPRIPGRRNYVNVESENTWETEPRQCGVREYLGDGTTSMWSPRIPAPIVSVLFGNNIQTVRTGSETVVLERPRVTSTNVVRIGEGKGGFNCFD